MTEEKQPGLEKQPNEARKYRYTKVFAIGTVLGLVFGTALGNIAMGLTDGLVWAALINAVHDKTQGKKNANAALAILVIVSMIMVLLLGLLAGGWF